MRKLERKIFQEAKKGCYIVSTHMTATKRFPKNIKRVDTKREGNNKSNKYYEEVFDYLEGAWCPIRVYKKVEK